ncbi:MAG TPA: outer membrane lipoprotein-sorting protein [Vicinamibacterales bacterium]|nr:outer membrane lipoprotein-sorting protein [Vicinamibacterales bacterium]
MKAVTTPLLAAALLLTCGRSAAAQTADDVVEKYLAAIGGRAALGKVTSRSTTGTMTLSLPNGPVSGAVEILSQRPNKTRTLTRLDLSSLGAGQVTREQRFNGTSGYILDSLQGNREITGNQLENLKNATFPTPLLTYKEQGATVELAGKEKVDGRDAYVMLFKPKTGSAARQFIDAETYLPVRIVVKVDTPETGEIEQTTDLSDYREVDGLKIPFTIKVSTGGQSFTIAVTKVEHNVKIDEAVFSRPDK